MHFSAFSYGLVMVDLIDILHGYYNDMYINVLVVNSGISNTVVSEILFTTKPMIW